MHLKITENHISAHCLKKMANFVGNFIAKIMLVQVQSVTSLYVFHT